MIVQYILKVGTKGPVNLSEERELWHSYGSKKRAEELGLVQLMFSCVLCAAARVHKRCMHYDQPLVYIREEDPDYDKQQQIEKEECLTIFIDTQVPLTFVTEDIPRCSANEELNVHQCPLGEECLCYYYRYTCLLSMDYIPLIAIHRAFGRVLPEIPEFEATPYLGPPTVRHAYRAWMMKSQNKRLTTRSLAAQLRKDDKLSDGEAFKSKMLELFKFKPRKDWRRWGLMDVNLLKVLKDRRITNYERLREYFEPISLNKEQTHGLSRDKRSESAVCSIQYIPYEDVLKRICVPAEKSVRGFDLSVLLQYTNPDIPPFAPPVLVELGNGGSHERLYSSISRARTSFNERNDSATESEVDE